MKSITELNKKNLSGKKVLLRVAYDAPLKKIGDKWTVADDRRIRETVPTIEYLLKNDCSIVLLSWLGRPKGQVVEKLKMDPVAKVLAKIIKQKVGKTDDCVGRAVVEKINKLKPREILMLENARFHPEEESNDRNFARQLVKGLDLIVFDAFAQAHRIHSSTTGITGLLPTYAGLLLAKELRFFEKLAKKPKRPFVAILAGAKISDKVGAIGRLVKVADKVLVGGGCANVFLKSLNVPVGKSFLEDVFVDKAKRQKADFIQMAKKLLKKYPDKIILPADLIAADKIDAAARTKIIKIGKGQIPDDWTFLDIGPETIKLFVNEINQAGTILWNGPMGIFEINKFSAGTKKIAEAVANAKALTIIGGGDTETVAAKYKLEKKFTHISTGGGAMLDFIASGGKLPGIKEF